MFSRLPLIGLEILAALVLFTGCASTTKNTAKVQVTELPDRVRVEIGNSLFTDYIYQDVPRPFLYPVLGPGSLPMTRNWPMKEAEGEEKDHPHHRSLWFTHGSVNGVDFWSEQKNFGKQLHEKFLELKSGKTGIIKTANKWIAADGKVVCRDERTVRIHGSENPRILDFEITLQASEGEVVLGDTKEGTMAIRLAETMRLKPNKHNEAKPAGHIVQNTGIREADTWGKRAAWCDYHGLVNGKLMGVAIFDHPKNPRHPTWWHVRDYGLFAANPFGIHDFEKKSPGSGNLTIPSGGSITFRYRFVFHEGDEKQANIADLFESFTQE